MASAGASVHEMPTLRTNYLAAMPSLDSDYAPNRIAMRSVAPFGIQLCGDGGVQPLRPGLPAALGWDDATALAAQFAFGSKCGSAGAHEGIVRDSGIVVEQEAS